MITQDLARKARALLVAANRCDVLPTEPVVTAVRRLLALPGEEAQPLRLCGARIAAALLSLEADDLPVTYASARCGRILREAVHAERLEYDLSLGIPPVPPEARAVRQ